MSPSKQEGWEPIQCLMDLGAKFLVRLLNSIDWINLLSIISDKHAVSSFEEGA